VESLKTKTRLWALIDETKGDLLSLITELVKRPSLNPPVNAKAITDYIVSYFQRYGIRHRVVGARPDRPIIIAEVRGAEKPGDAVTSHDRTLCLNGHTDVVGPGDLSKWAFDPHCGTVTDRQVLGRGTSDMLSGVAIDMHILRLLSEHKLQFEGKVVMHLVPDEETGSEMGTRWLTENHYADGIDGVILGEPTSWCNVEIGSKGSMLATVRSFGTQAHGSVASFVGDNAIVKMSTFLGRLEELRTLTAEVSEDQRVVIRFSKEVAERMLGVSDVGDAIDHITYSVSTIRSGTPGKAECEYCEAKVHFRIPNGVRVKQLRDRFLEIGRQCGVECEVTRVIEPACTFIREPIVQMALDNASLLYGKKVVPVYQWASSDGLYYRSLGIPTVQHGPANIGGIHGYNETVDIDEVILVAKVHLGIIADFFYM
jgi:succinyl-diaminopimelate desuccinylase